MIPIAEDTKIEMIERVLDLLGEGKFLAEICKDKTLPDSATIWRWSKGNDELATAIARARERGYHNRAERAVLDAKNAEDPARGRLAFDAERWHLSKLCKAFADKVAHTGADGGAIEIRAVERRIVDVVPLKLISNAGD